MPLPNPFSPSKSKRSQRRRSESTEIQITKKEKKKIDNAIWQKFWENSRSVDVHHEGRPLTPALPYSKDFGTFDLTLCEGPDGRCLVLVEYDQRIFLNGKQIYVTDDGKVTDDRGLSDRILSNCFQCVMEAKYKVRQKEVLTKTKGTKRGTRPMKRRSEPLTRDGYQDQSEQEVKSTRSSHLKERPSVRFRLPEVDQDDHHGHHLENDQSRNPRRLTSELQRLETDFSENIGHLCSLIVELSDRNHADTESAKSEDYALDQQAEYLINMLTRLSDQFQSMVGLSSTLREDAQEVNSSRCGAQRTDDNKFSCDTGIDSSSSEEGQVISVWSREEADEVLRNDHHQQKDNLTSSPSETQNDLVENLRHENQKLREEVEALDGDMSRAHQLLEDIEDRLATTTRERDQLRERVDPAESSAPFDPGQMENQLPDTKQLLVDYFEEDCSHNTAFYTGSDSESDKDEIIMTKPTAAESKIGIQPSLRNEIQRLRNVYNDVGNSLEILSEENILLRANVVSLRKEKENVHKRLDHEKTKNVDLKKNIEKLDGLNAELEERLATLERENLRMEVELQTLRQGQTEKAATGRILERKLTESMANCRLLETQQADHHKELELVAQKQLEETARASHLAKTIAELEVEVTELRNAKEKLTVENHLLRAENDANCTARGNAESLTRQYEEDLKLMRSEKEDALTNSNRLSSLNGVLQETITTLEDANKELTQKVVKLEAANSVLGGQNGDFKSKLKSAEKELADLKGTSHRLELENIQTKEKVMELTQTNSEMKSRMEFWNRESSDMGQKMDRLIRTKAELHGMLQKLNGLNNDIEMRFEQMDSEYEELEKRLKGSDEILKVSPGN